MTYRELFDLKFKQGMSTSELVRRYPNDKRRVSEVALLDIPEETLEEVVQEKDILSKLKHLKKKFFGI